MKNEKNVLRIGDVVNIKGQWPVNFTIGYISSYTEGFEGYGEDVAEIIRLDSEGKCHKMHIHVDALEIAPICCSNKTLAVTTEDINNKIIKNASF